MADTGNVSARRGGKSADAFRTISEVADDLDVPQHVLRFWETKFNQVRPMKRGGGRRYYRPEDVDLLRSIRALLYNDGYTIKGVQKLLREGNVRPVQAGEVAANSEAAPTTTSEARQTSPTPPPRGRLAEAQRRELEAVLAELEALRKLIDSAG